MNQVVQLPLGPGSAGFAAEPESSLRTDVLYVVYSTTEATIAALHAAARFAAPSGTAVRLIHFRTLPFAQPIDGPCGISPIETDAFRARLDVEGLSVRTQVYLCRDERTAIERAWQGALLVFVGGGRWSRQPAKRLRQALKAAGHFVVLVDPSRVKENIHA